MPMPLSSVPRWLRARLSLRLRSPGRGLLTVLSLGLCLGATMHRPAHAWGADGHRTTGVIAQRLIAGTNAEQKVQALLGGLTLAQASVWADCAKGIEPRQDYRYTTTGRYPSCAPFETPEGMAEMADFVRRNDRSCEPPPGEHSCHKGWHYTDVPLQRGAWQAAAPGTHGTDIVRSLQALLRVLQGQAVGGPWHIASEREALLLLVHLVGDIHQPLHVGAPYLDPQDGRLVDPGDGPVSAATDTKGGNRVAVLREDGSETGSRLHALWDDIPSSLDAGRLKPAWLTLARQVPAPAAPLAQWPQHWADETLAQAREALAGARYAALGPGHWTVTLSPAQRKAVGVVQRERIIAAGAHLAQVLRALWP